MIDLNGIWQLYYRQEGTDEPWACIPGRVPGNVELDLVAAGVEADPFYGENLYAFRKYEFYEWRLERSFEMPPLAPGACVSLVLEGVNTYADVFINEQWIGSCDNMLIAHELKIRDALKTGENRLCVHIHSAANIARKKEYPVMLSANDRSDEYLWQRKPPHCFGWDIMPRLPSAGLWRGVCLRISRPTRLTQCYYATVSVSEQRAQLRYKWRFVTDEPALDDFSVRVSCDGVNVCQQALFVSGEGQLTVEHPRLWWPRGYGEAALYTVTMELLHHGQVVDSKTERIGLRTVEIKHVMKPDDQGEFRIDINGCPILAKGSNWVPLDALHSRDAGRYERALALFAQAGCNILRCWGGNVYEDHRFFELCDELGIMVWQDFSMACAAYPQDEDFAGQLAAEATFIIQKLRNHPSLILWAGDNEVDEYYLGLDYLPQHCYNRLTREVLPRQVAVHDPYRMFLPSSPYIDRGVERYHVPEQHNWGARAYFKDDFYKHTNAHFISECGYHGCPSPQSLARFLPPDKLWPMENTAWDTHSTEYVPLKSRHYNRNNLMADQVAILFGVVPDTLEEFSLLSQVSQAEAKKFFIERTRLKKWRRTGIIWWNMLDGWPQISDAVVDYYWNKKRTFSYIRRVQQPVCILFDELVDWTHAVVLGNDSREDHRVSYRVLEFESGETVFSGAARSPANENVTLGSLRVLVGAQRLYLIQWELENGVIGCNHYITGYPPYRPEIMHRWLAAIDAMEEEGPPFSLS